MRAEFVPNGRNRVMYVTYKFANFKKAGRDGGVVVLENDCSRIQEFSGYVTVEAL